MSTAPQKPLEHQRPGGFFDVVKTQRAAPPFAVLNRRKTVGADIIRPLVKSSHYFTVERDLDPAAFQRLTPFCTAPENLPY